MKKFFIIFTFLLILLFFVFGQKFFQQNEEKIFINNLNQENFDITSHNMDIIAKNSSEGINEFLNPFNNYDIMLDEKGNISYSEKIFNKYYIADKILVLNEYRNEEKNILKQYLYNEETGKYSMSFSAIYPNVDD